MMRSIMLALLAAAAAGLSACAGGGPNLYQRLQDEDPKVRVDAAVEAGRTHDAQAVALLIERLDDSEQDVRFYSILALERITGQTFGYKCYEPVEARRQAIERWRQYAAKAGKPAKPATKPASAVAVPAAPDDVVCGNIPRNGKDADKSKIRRGEMSATHAGGTPASHTGKMPVPHTGKMPMPHMGKMPVPHMGETPMPLPDTGGMPVPLYASAP